MTGFRVFLFVLLSTFFFAAKGQESVEVGDSLNLLKPWQLKSFGKNAQRLGDSYSAIDYYERYLSRKPDNTKIKYELALLYRQTRDYEQALSTFQQVSELEPEKRPEALFYAGQMEKMLGRYNAALGQFEAYRSLSKKVGGDKSLRKLVKIEIAGCTLAPNAINTPQKVLITHVDTFVNKAHVELAPRYLDDSTVIYGGVRSRKTPYFQADAPDSLKPWRQFHQAHHADTGWVYDGLWNPAFETNDQHTGDGVISPDGKRFYFTRCKANWQGKMICNIYVSQKKDSVWQAPEPLPKPINLKRFTSTQPAIGRESKKNREMLFFVSDRPNGKGGLDIWYTVYDKRKGEFKAPRHAGSKINTVGNEVTPYYDQDNRNLYFSSDGRPGMGGLDVFRATGEQRKWSEAENLGYPLNTHVDELYYTLSPDKSKGMFVSNRSGGVALRHETCCDDIYAFHWSAYINVKSMGTVVVVADSNQTGPLSTVDQSELSNREILKGVNISLFLIDDEGNELLLRTDSTNEDGQFEMDLEQGRKYKLVAHKRGYYTEDATISTESSTFNDTVNIPFAMRKIEDKPILVPNIYFEFGKHELTEETKRNIDSTLYLILAENPDLVLEVGAHTDNKGSEKYNQWLSQNRAESVTKYLQSKGISKKRLKAKGYGESEPISPNENEDGTDNPEGREQNRRTEFRVVKILDEVEEED